MGVEFIPCQMTMDMFGLKRADLIDGMGEPVGAATSSARHRRRHAAVHLTPVREDHCHDRDRHARPHPSSSTPAAASARVR